MLVDLNSQYRDSCPLCISQSPTLESLAHSWRRTGSPPHYKGGWSQPSITTGQTQRCERTDYISHVRFIDFYEEEEEKGFMVISISIQDNGANFLQRGEPFLPTYYMGTSRSLFMRKFT